MQADRFSLSRVCCNTGVTNSDTLPQAEVARFRYDELPLFLFFFSFVCVRGNVFGIVLMGKNEEVGAKPAPKARTGACKLAEDSTQEDEEDGAITSGFCQGAAHRQ